MFAIFKYYADCFVFNAGFSLLIASAFGGYWGIAAFSSLGTLIGALGFGYFKQQEYYFYYNLGFTKSALLLRAGLINVLLAIPLLLIYTAIISMLTLK